MPTDPQTAVTIAGPPEGDHPPSVPPVSSGAAFERYIILELLGEGGMGKVYSAHDPGLNRRVALKFLHARLARSVATEWRARLVREAQAMARLSHPNVVIVYDVGLADDQVFIAMELVEGGSVRRWIDLQPRSWREVVAVFLEAGSGLAAAHKAGVVHRDFKPDNVLLGADGRARVTDFGLARASTDPAELERTSRRGLVDLPPPPPPSAEGSDQLTVAGVFMGTQGYMAVEQYDEGPIDARTDVFAFCVSLWEALYGEMPFAADDPRALEARVRSGKPREPKGGRAVPRWVRRVVEKGLAPSPVDRYQSMAALLAALEADPAKRWWRRASSIAVGLAVAGAWYAVHAREGRRERACVEAGDEIQAVWNDARREEMVRAFDATGLTYAHAAANTVGGALDAYAHEWSASATDACRATRVRGEQSETMLDLRHACLASRREELRALGGLLMAPDGAAIEKAGRAARALSPVAECADLDKLSSQPPPGDPTVRAEVRALDGEVADAKILFEAGKPLKSRDLLLSIRDRVERTGYGPLLATWAFRTGVAEGQGDEKSATTDLERSFFLADEYRLDDVRARAALYLGKLEGSWTGRSEDAHRWLRLAAGVIARMGNPPALAIERDTDEGWAYAYEQLWAEATPLFRRGLERMDAAKITDPELRAQAESGLGLTLGAQGKGDEAVARQLVAVGVIERAYGSENTLLTGYLNNLADAQLTAGALDDALVTLQRVLTMARARVARGELSERAPIFGWPNQTMGEVLLRLGRADEAAVQLERARDVYLAAHGVSNAEVAFVDYELAEGYRRVGRASDAERVLSEAEQIAAAQRLPDGMSAGILLERAQIELDHGDRAHATASATRALALREKEGVAREINVARVVLSRALAKTDPKRAQELAELARAGFEGARDAGGAREATDLLATLPSATR